MKRILERANNLTCYHLNINKLIVIAQAKKAVFTVTRAPRSIIPDCKLVLNFSKKKKKRELKSRTKTDNWAPKVRNVQGFTSNR